MESGFLPRNERMHESIKIQVSILVLMESGFLQKAQSTEPKKDI